MTKSNSNKFIPKIQDLQQFLCTHEGSVVTLRILGYGLLAMSLFDWIALFIPANFMDAVWEFKTMGGIVERVPVPLIGLFLIFYGESFSRSNWELWSLKFLSWLSFLLAILFILMIPLGVMNTIRLNKQNFAQINAISQQQINRAQSLELQLKTVSPQQIENFLNTQGISSNNKDPQELKTQVLSEISQAKKLIKTQTTNIQSLKKLNLIKTAVKWNLSAVISAALFFILWKTSSWSREW
ncbi:MAG: HpsJ family protein [Mastigocoleus sp.]